MEVDHTGSIGIFLARRAAAPPQRGSDAPTNNNLGPLRIAVGFDDTHPDYVEMGCAGYIHPLYEQEMPLVLMAAGIYMAAAVRRTTDETREAFDLIEGSPNREVELVVREEDLRSQPRRLLLSLALLLTGLRQDPAWIQKHEKAAIEIATEIVEGSEFRLTFLETFVDSEFRFPSLEAFVANIDEVLAGRYPAVDFAAALKAWFTGCLAAFR